MLNLTPPDQQDPPVSASPLTEQEWLRLATSAFTASTTYFETSVRGKVINNLRQFQGMFPQGSKYLSDAYRGRSKFFRPKTRAVVRKNEAIAAEAFFSSFDVVNVHAKDEDDPIERASADVNKELLQYRLTTKGKDGIPWFQILLGAYQDAQVQGLVCSYQSWELNKKKNIDRPSVKLRPIENIRFDPNADWCDPVSTSPYFIEMIPMYVKDVKARMRTIDGTTGRTKWKFLPDSELLKATTHSSDIVRLQREYGRADPRVGTSGITDYSIVWVHRNIMEVDGEDWVFHTLGTVEVLDVPRQIAEVWHHGQRPYVIGFSVLETHRQYPPGPVELIKDAQGELNENANQRLDNVKFAMNKRYFVKRNTQVDLRSLQRNVPSSTTLMNDPEKDVKIVETRDVTSSAFEEQDRLSLDIDDLAGSFSQATVQSNRKLNETVGGMNILTKDASQITGYQLRTFSETWVEKVLEQLVLLEQFYETDDVILALAADKANVYQRFGIDTITDNMLMRVLTVTVNVGVGATNPNDQLRNFLQGMTALEQMLASGVLVKYGADVAEIMKEVFGHLGYRDGKRFFPDEQDPRISALTQTIEELQQALDQKMPPEIIKATVEKMRAQTKKEEAYSVKIGVESAYSAMQTGQTIAAVPMVAPIGDKVMQAAGYQTPKPPGVDPNYPQPGVSPMSSVAPPSPMPGAMPGPAAGDTTPTTPMKPASSLRPETPGVGSQQGIETMRADGI